METLSICSEVGVQVRVKSVGRSFKRSYRSILTKTWRNCAFPRFPKVRNSNGETGLQCWHATTRGAAQQSWEPPPEPPSWPWRYWQWQRVHHRDPNEGTPGEAGTHAESGVWESAGWNFRKSWWIHFFVFVRCGIDILLNSNVWRASNIHAEIHPRRISGRLCFPIAIRNHDTSCGQRGIIFTHKSPCFVGIEHHQNCSFQAFSHDPVPFQLDQHFTTDGSQLFIRNGLRTARTLWKWRV